jgi:hypothetical protein
MTEQERALVLSLAGAKGRLTPAEFLREFGTTDGTELGLHLLGDACDRRDQVDVELALVVAFKFGFSDAFLPLLLDLAFADWHKSHENVAWELGELKSPYSVDALLHLAQWVPDYLDWDDNRALGVKAVWSLRKIGTKDARRALETLTHSDSAVIARNAIARLRDLG